MPFTETKADARVLSKYMRTECLNHKFVYEAPIQAGRLVSAVADSKLFHFCFIFLESQVHTQRYGRRPYGVGLLVIGYDVRTFVRNIDLLSKPAPTCTRLPLLGISTITRQWPSAPDLSPPRPTWRSTLLALKLVSDTDLSTKAHIQSISWSGRAYQAQFGCTPRNHSIFR